MAHPPTVPCRRCGTQLYVVTEPEPVFHGIAVVHVHVLPHTCYRILIAEYWEAGEVIATMHSDHPGVTGPYDLVLACGAEADRGWRPPASDGWTYRWQLDQQIEAR